MKHYQTINSYVSPENNHDLIRKIDLLNTIEETITTPNYGGKFYGIKKYTVPIPTEGYEEDTIIAIPKYRVSANNLFVYKNGLLLTNTKEYNEMGEINSSSESIILNIEISNTDILDLVIFTLSPSTVDDGSSDPIDDPDYIGDIGTILAPHTVHYYVNITNGSDSNNGLTPETPKKYLFQLKSLIESFIDYTDIFIHLSEGTHTGTSGVFIRELNSISYSSSSVASTLVFQLGSHIRLRFIGEGQEKTTLLTSVDSTILTINSLNRTNQIIFESCTINGFDSKASCVSIFNCRILKSGTTDHALVFTDGIYKLHNVLIQLTYTTKAVIRNNIGIVYISGDFIIQSSVVFEQSIQILRANTSIPSIVNITNAYVQIDQTNATSYVFYYETSELYITDSILDIIYSVSSIMYGYLTATAITYNTYPQLKLNNVSINAQYVGAANTNGSCIFAIMCDSVFGATEYTYNLNDLTITGNQLKSFIYTKQYSSSYQCKANVKISGIKNIEVIPSNKFINATANTRLSVQTYGEGVSGIPGNLYNTIGAATANNNTVDIIG
jgi:hypothetical protein